MKLMQIFMFIISWYFLPACANKQTSTDENINQKDTTIFSATTNVSDSFPAGKIIADVVCKNDASQSYALYIPHQNKKFTVVYFFDPHGDGSLPLKKYKALADKYNYVLIGSNNSKNGNDWQTTENIWQQLYNDSQSRLACNQNRIYACGFSGGAKAASYIALHNNSIKAVIAGGAGLPDETPAGNFNFSFTALAGEGDMNMTDLVALNDDLNKTQTKHRIIFFKGKHEWAPETAMDIAFAGLQLDAMRNNFISKNDSFINAFISNSKKRLDEDIKKNDLLQAKNECILSANMLDELADVSWFKQKENAIENEAAYKSQLQQQQQLYAIEQNKKAEYNQQFQQGDINYWSKTINDLNAKSKAFTPQAEMYQRLLAYLSLAFYSISNQFINNNQNKEAEYFVTLYKMADPTNSEAWYFSAVLNARNNDAQKANDDLLKAVANGFTDKQRMRQQPEFQNLQPQINFAVIESKMKSTGLNK